jgi:hypothetical protein
MACCHGMRVHRILFPGAHLWSSRRGVVPGARVRHVLSLPPPTSLCAGTHACSPLPCRPRGAAGAWLQTAPKLARCGEQEAEPNQAKPRTPVTLQRGPNTPGAAPPEKGARALQHKADTHTHRAGVPHDPTGCRQDGSCSESAGLLAIAARGGADRVHRGKHPGCRPRARTPRPTPRQMGLLTRPRLGQKRKAAALGYRQEEATIAGMCSVHTTSWFDSAAGGHWTCHGRPPPQLQGMPPPCALPTGLHQV